MSTAVFAEIVGTALEQAPMESCGLLVGNGETCTRFVSAANLAGSAIVYSLDPKVHLRVEREADDSGEEVIGVFHSHTHTDALPSPTDIAVAPDPSWHYLIVSLRDFAPAARSWLISSGGATEEQVVVVS